MTAQQDDLVLRLPLSGAYLIEASAGTGKTFTLTAWLLRLLLEGGVPLPKLLVVTFTRAATAELRDRVRRRLRIAERLLAGDSVEGEEALQTAALIAHARSTGIDEATLDLRLQAALLQLDEAAISTIHGFCQRALREFGFLAGALNDDEVIDNAGELWGEVAADLWRVASNGDAQGFDCLCRLWSAPEALARSLPRLCDPARRLLPEAGESDLATWLHELRAEAGARFEQALAERSQRTQDQLIEQVWQASEQPAFCAALRQRWPMLLVDEFQDTDPRQWRIFRRIFEAEGEAQAGLFLIGDPKQAIYRFRGGDLPTYLQAREFARARGGEASLDTNYRSRPAVLAAIEALFTASTAPFIDRSIEFHHVHASARADDAALKVAGEAPPGLVVHWLPPDPGGKSRRPKEADTDSAIAMTVAEIVRLLNHGTLTDSALNDRSGEHRLRPGDIAVLVRQNKQVAWVRDALAAAGIAAATQSNDSVFASDAAGEVRALLLAFAAPSDPMRARAALATRLLGEDAAAIAALEGEALELQRWQVRFEQAGALWQQRGPLPALLPFLTGTSETRLREHGGARLLTDALHLAELLQAEAPVQHGVHGLLRWFSRHCDDPPAHEDMALRLDADTDAVQVATLHKSKGLEYPVVFLPFTAFSSGGGGSGGVQFVQAQDAQGRPAQYAYKTRGSGKQRQVVLGSASHDDWLARDEEAERAEDLRLLYVGLTRAQYALHVVWGHTFDSNDTALQWLLHAGDKAGRKNDALQPAGMRERIAALAATTQGKLVVRDIPDPMPAPPALQAREEIETLPASRIPNRRLRMGGGQYSFSGLRARHSETLPARGADDEAVAAPVEGDSAILRGADFGNAVHDALEAADFAQWQGRTIAPAQAVGSVQQALKRRGLPQTPAAQTQVATLVARALNVPLPGIGTLAELDASQRVAEMEFHFRLGATRLSQLFALLDQHGYPRQHAQSRQGEIEGLMHGYIDLVYRDGDGGHYVLDYKTNQLRSYDPQACAEAVRGNDYDLQYLIYLVALQRWLRLRSGADYDPARHLGGAVYLFLRGLEPGSAQAGTAGIHRDRPPQALIDALDRLFDGGAA